jgi:ABC-2 type transport system ATP-binding protein
MTVKENVDFFAGIHGLRRSDVRSYRDELIDRFGLTAQASTAVRLLSRGMQQKVSLICALVRRTKTLVLDEPTLGLDPDASRELRRHLKTVAASGTTVLLSSHDLPGVEQLCDRVILMKAGRIVADDLVQRLIRPPTVRTYLVVIDGPLSASARQHLAGAFPALVVTTVTQTYESTTSLQLEIEDGSRLYELLGILQSEGLRLREVHSDVPSLEQVFIDLTQRRFT